MRFPHCQRVHPDNSEPLFQYQIWMVWDYDLLQVIEMGKHGTVAVIAIEDLIADRMGQFASGSAAEMLDQARALFKLSTGLDRHYMDRRIREETAQEYGIQELEDEA